MSLILYKTFISFFIILLFNNILHANDIKDFNFIQSHEVIYDLRIENVTPASKIHNAIGKMNLKVQEVCDGWVVNQNTYIDITDKNGIQARNEFRNSSWESFDFNKFRFLSQVIIDGEEASYFEGESDLNRNIPKIIFSSPFFKELILPKDTIFPMQHYFNTYKSHNMFNAYNVFFGEDDESLNYVTSFSTDTKIGEILYKKVRSAIFKYEESTLNPIYEIELIINNNGIVQKVVFDYLDYRIVGNILKLNLIEQKNC